MGKVVVKRMLGGELGRPAKIVVFSRDEGKHHQMRVDFAHLSAATDEIAYTDFERILEFRLVDVRDYSSLVGAVAHSDIVINHTRHAGNTDLPIAGLLTDLKDRGLLD